MAIANCQTYGRSLTLRIKIASTSNTQTALPAFLRSSLNETRNCRNDQIVATIVQQNMAKLLRCRSWCFKNVSKFHRRIFTKLLNRHIPSIRVNCLTIKMNDNYKSNTARAIASLCDNISYQSWKDYVYLRKTLRDNRIEKPRCSELDRKLTDSVRATPKTVIIERDR